MRDCGRLWGLDVCDIVISDDRVRSVGNGCFGSLIEVGCPYGSMTAQGQEIVSALGSMDEVCVYVYMLSPKGVAVVQW